MSQHHIPVAPFNQRKRLKVVQILSVVMIIGLIFSRPLWNEDTTPHDIMEMLGVGFILACIFGRLWSILYVGGHKNTNLITLGPYSVTRNPLYFFSTLGAIGIGLTFGSLLVAVVFGLLTYLVFRFTALREATFLADKFGDDYAEYARQTPLYWPNIMNYRDSFEITFSTRALFKTFVDAMFFLATVPLLEGLEYLHTQDIVPTLFWLP